MTLRGMIAQRRERHSQKAQGPASAFHLDPQFSTLADLVQLQFALTLTPEAVSSLCGKRSQLEKRSLEAQRDREGTVADGTLVGNRAHDARPGLSPKRVGTITAGLPARRKARWLCAAPPG
jgi:hypothetical protein